MAEKKISIIIPCYNAEEYIERCIESLVNQSIGIEALECIFVDDASTDQTLSVLMNWEKKYPESIIVIPCQENHKQGAARNIGLSYATGDYIGFVDSDDYVSKEMYEKLYEKAERFQCDVTGCLLKRERADGSIAWEEESVGYANRRVDVTSIDARKELLLHDLPGGIVSRIYRREIIFDQQLFFPEDIKYEDNYWNTFLKFLISSYFIINEPHYHYIVNEQSTVMQKDAMHHLDRLVIELMKVEECKKREWFSLYHDEIEFEFLRLYFINTIRIIFVRFAEMPYEIIFEMQNWVKELFPDYKKNPYLGHLPPLQLEILKIVEVPLTKEKIDILSEGYRKVLRNI